MSRTRVIIFTVFVIAGIYDFAAEYVKLANLPTISYLFNEYLFQFSFWEFVVGLTLGHLFFNRCQKNQKEL